MSQPEAEEEETQNVCSKCETIPTNFITLKCNHNLCLRCSTNNLA